MANRREREIKDQIEKVGLQVLEYDPSGPHIKVKVCHPLLKDARRTFVYGRTARGDVRRDKNEEAELLRWKRSITEPANHHVENPMEAAWKKAGLAPSDRLPTPIVHAEPPKKVHVVAHAAQVAVRQPAKWTPHTPVEPPRSAEEFRQEIACECELAHGRDPRNDPVLNAFINANPDMKAHVEDKAGPRAVYTPPEPAKEPTVTDKPNADQGDRPHARASNSQEPSKQTLGGNAKKGVKNNMLGRPKEIKLIDWLRVSGRLDRTNSLILAEQATKDLGFQVTHSNVLGLLRDMDLEITNPVRRGPPSGVHVTKHDYLAQCLVAVIEHTGGEVPELLMKLALCERNDLRFNDAPLPKWPHKG